MPSPIPAGFPDLRKESLLGVKGKVCLVTGGGTGIGRMMATALVRNGATCYISSRKLDVLEKVAKEITEIGPGKCYAIQADLSSKKACYDLAAELSKREDKLHLMVNNSGASWGSPLEDYPEQQGWVKIMQLNLMCIFYLTTACLPLLEKGSRGPTDPSRVVTVASALGIVPHDTYLGADGMTNVSYNATKAADLHMTRHLAGMLAKRGVLVNTIAPGIVPTKFVKFGMSKNNRLLLKEYPMGRFAVPTDVAGTILFLASKASAHVTGATLVLDGGWSLEDSGYARL
ncbi:NAD(P)-binding protein [Gonapodya prolifera JEL478]|uniref:NAD(P)-binding protein n=1 Tax=Gonapodya prolifera (strain JEL478) TaxID=1344416 RepID=A0A139AT83_GONPJ|nr:NAD(P)-binding protein [Gonapodya prolifera JEL478]|eukprot:KXS19941.1 NAD(P)-binding protein [Gonapodya prolifera JEL478]